MKRIALYVIMAIYIIFRLSPGRGEFGAISVKCTLHDDCMATSTRIVVSGDMKELSIHIKVTQYTSNSWCVL